MPFTLSRRLLWIYALLVLLAAWGYARYDSYSMDGDGTSFLDIAEALRTHHAALAVNAYWNPGYPALLALAERAAHPDLWHELVAVRYANVAIFALAIVACLFFTTGLTRARLDRDQFAVETPALHLLGLALLLLSLGRELPVAAPRADTLLFALLLLAGGLLLRILRGGARAWVYAALGLTLGLAYLTKSFAFLPSIVLIAALVVRPLLQGAGRPLALARTALLAAVFASVAGPYILAISRQTGHFTTGESARLNYAFFIDGMPRWHEWFHHDLGHAGGVFAHPETALLSSPPVYSYAAHPAGTFPLWFDPAWWTLGLQPHVWLPGQLKRLARNVVVFARYLLGRPEPFVLLAVLLAFGARPPSLRLGIWWLPPAAWGVLMLAIYLPVDLQDRYLTAPLFLVLLPVFAALRTRSSQSTSQAVIANALIVLFAVLLLGQSATYLADRRRHTPPAEQRHPGFDAQIFAAAAALDRLGLRPGDKVACMGDQACYTDFYWARLAGAQILAEVETPGNANPMDVWNSIPDKPAVTSPLAHTGARFLVSMFPNSATKPDGWVQLGGSNFFAFLLQEPPSAQAATRIAKLRATP